jgi:prophage antirepressor-like protein
MNALQEFKFNQSNVRIVMVNDEPWFVARDVCDILGLSDVSMFVLRLDDTEKLIQKLFVSGQNRDTYTINESGLYALIFTSTKPEAKAFRKWVTSEVLPQIRRTSA